MNTITFNIIVLRNRTRSNLESLFHVFETTFGGSNDLGINLFLSKKYKGHDRSVDEGKITMDKPDSEYFLSPNTKNKYSLGSPAHKTGALTIPITSVFS
jgi:hypothetical protein